MKDGKNKKWLLNSYFSEIRNILTIFLRRPKLPQKEKAGNIPGCTLMWVL
jgi:hypothetical protein